MALPCEKPITEMAPGRTYRNGALRGRLMPMGSNKALFQIRDRISIAVECWNAPED